MRFLALCLAFLLPGCVIVIGSSCDIHGVHGSGVEKTETRTVLDFERIEIEGQVEAVITVGGPTALTVSGDANVLPHLRTEVRGNRLVLGLDHGSYSLAQPLRATITVPALEGVEIDGAGDADVRGLSGERFEVSISGSGSLEARGEVRRVEVSISGSGDARLFELRAEDAEVEISGSGNAAVSATRALEVSVTGSGDVRYRGDPKVEKRISGSGSVTRE